MSTTPSRSHLLDEGDRVRVRASGIDGVVTSVIGDIVGVAPKAGELGSEYHAQELEKADTQEEDTAADETPSEAAETLLNLAEQTAELVHEAELVEKWDADVQDNIREAQRQGITYEQLIDRQDTAQEYAGTPEYLAEQWERGGETNSMAQDTAQDPVEAAGHAVHELHKAASGTQADEASAADAYREQQALWHADDQHTDTTTGQDTDTH